MTRDGPTTKTACFNSSPKTVLNVFDLEDDLKSSSEEINNKIAIWISEGSVWTIKSVNCLWINIVQYNPVKGSSYIPLPTELTFYKGIDQHQKQRKWKLFQVVPHPIFHPQGKDTQIIEDDRNYINKFDYSDIEFPVSIKQLNKIEKQKIINVSVLGYAILSHLCVKRTFHKCIESLIDNKKWEKASCPHKRF